MHRREFLHTLTAAALMLQSIDAVASPAPLRVQGARLHDDDGVREQLQRAQHPDRHYGNDVYIEAGQKPVLLALQQRLGRLQKTVGHGNFALLGVDEMRAFGRNYPAIGRFVREEEALMEQLFYADAGSYGFYGEKPLGRLTDRIERRDLSRLSGSSQYLFKGEALAAYARIKEALGDEVVLTSGVRGVVKQMHLFLSKAVASNGNLSQASRSLAPPGYSFHGIGDFDVGQRGWGARNFTADFANSEVFNRLQDLGYIAMRYPADNQIGVRYEPWHIKVVSA